MGRRVHNDSRREAKAADECESRVEGDFTHCLDDDFQSASSWIIGAQGVGVGGGGEVGGGSQVMITASDGEEHQWREVIQAKLKFEEGRRSVQIPRSALPTDRSRKKRRERSEFKREIQRRLREGFAYDSDSYGHGHEDELSSLVSTPFPRHYGHVPVLHDEVVEGCVDTSHGVSVGYPIQCQKVTIALCRHCGVVGPISEYFCEVPQSLIHSENDNHTAHSAVIQDKFNSSNKAQWNYGGKAMEIKNPAYTDEDNHDVDLSTLGKHVRFNSEREELWYTNQMEDLISRDRWTLDDDDKRNIFSEGGNRGRYLSELLKGEHEMGVRDPSKSSVNEINRRLKYIGPMHRRRRRTLQRELGLTYDENVSTLEKILSRLLCGTDLLFPRIDPGFCPL